MDELPIGRPGSKRSDDPERGKIYVPPGGPGRLPELSPEIFAAMGEERIFGMLRDFYGELERSVIRRMFGEDLEASSERAAAFYVQLFGGPPLFDSRYGNPMMRRRHMPFRIDEASRKVWLGCFLRILERAEEDYSFPAEHLPAFRLWLDGFSRWMVNTKHAEDR
jgi:hemoglobin